MLTPPHALAPLAVLELYPLQAPHLAHGVVDPTGVTLDDGGSQGLFRR
jgi:hypothetical protein